jgi:hypothetical protein
MSNRIISRGKHSEIGRRGVTERWSLASVNNPEFCVGRKEPTPVDNQTTGESKYLALYHYSVSKVAVYKF